MEIYKQIKKDIRFWLTIYFVIFAIVQSVYYFFDLGKDDSDSAESRSNMSVRTDHKTGCQYLESSKGDLTPRLQKDGTQMCL